MLTGYQCEVVAYTTDGALVCDECFERNETTIRVAQWHLGRDLPPDTSPVIRYSVEEYGYYPDDEDEDHVTRYSADPTYYPPTCDHCHKEID